MTLPHKALPDQEVRRNFESVDRRLGEGAILDSQLASPNNAVYRTIFSSQGFMVGTLVAGTYLLGVQGSTATSRMIGTAGVLNAGGSDSFYPPSVFYLDDADYTVARKTTYLRTRVTTACNATDPGVITYTLGLYPMTVAGTATNIAFTAGTVVSGSNGAAVVDPTLSTVESDAGVDFAVPADGAYMLAVVTTDTVSTNGVVGVFGQLQMRHT